MSSRDHPFNRSTRPLLERKCHAQPQLLSTKKKISAPNGAQSSPKMRGFNDFTFVPKLHAPPDLHTYYAGYPYGSPPSPTSAIGHSDFVFSDDSGVHSNDLSHSTSSGTHHPVYDEDYADTGDSCHYSLGNNGLVSGNGLYQTIGGQNSLEYHRWSPAPPVERPQYVSVEATKGPFIFGVDANGVDRFRSNGKAQPQQLPQHFNNNSVIQSKSQRAEQQVIKAVSETL